MKHLDYDYIETPLEDCYNLGAGLKAAGKTWHSHVLSPGCRFNPYAGAYAIIVEDSTAGATYIARSEDFPEVDKQFVKMLHGDDILDEGKSQAGGAGEAIESALLDQVVAFDARKVPWHHHMNFPDCVFNPEKGRWAISVESGDGDFAHESYDDEPVDVLREMEVRYFRNLGGA
ncbi:MAG: hypothetical protein HOH66_15245 [Rhodospirillaceae bacterium]|jgi:hypothetical protein|nr:hypothetical protein [Rhodospirillaceae bacterium]